MKRRPFHPSTGLLLACLVLVAFSTQTRAQRERGGGTPLKTGSPLPDVTAHDATGNPVELRQAVKGKHAVIVFGCLT